MSPEEALRVPPEALGRGTNIKVEILTDAADVIYEFARALFNEIRRNNAAGKKSVFIVPVGPVGQYPILARWCNTERVSCADVVLINMDEYCTDDGDLVPYENPLSFRRHMDLNFYSLLDPEVAVRSENRVFPDPERPEAIAEIIEAAGGLDVCFAGIGITGHIAFNDPPEPGERITPAEFRNLPTRVVALSRESALVNAITGARGDWYSIPRKAVTVGMREILGARRIRVFMAREWQSAVARLFIHGPVTPSVPASFLQEHPDVAVVMTKATAVTPEFRLG